MNLNNYRYILIFAMKVTELRMVPVSCLCLPAYFPSSRMQHKIKSVQIWKILLNWLLVLFSCEKSCWIRSGFRSQRTHLSSYHSISIKLFTFLLYLFFLNTFFTRISNIFLLHLNIIFIILFYLKFIFHSFFIIFKYPTGQPLSKNQNEKAKRNIQIIE